jgi:hypothetical protein
VGVFYPRGNMKTFTKQELELAKVARDAKRKALQAQTKDYKKDWLDDNYWLDLGNLRGIRLPAMYLPATEKSLRKWARKLGKQPFSEHFGCSPASLIAKNPKVPLRAFVGQMLEP